MTIRTISQLEPAENITDADLMYMSQRDIATGGYTSKSIYFGTLTDGIKETVINEVQNRFYIPTLDPQYGGNFSVNQLINRVKTISADNMTFYGVKTFDVPPESLTNLRIDADNTQIPNSHTVKQMIQAYSNTIAPSSIVDFDPENNTGHTAYLPGKEMIWHIDDNSNDSSLFIEDEVEQRKAGYISCNNNGWLVVYGWVSDGGNVLPQEAWVGLYGKIKTANQTDPAQSTDWQEEREVLLQCQPWVVGSKSSTMQYVSFGIPVKKGLMLKIKTGFKVSGHISGMQHSNSLMFNGIGMMPNTFVGYIIYNQ